MTGNLAKVMGMVLSAVIAVSIGMSDVAGATEFPLRTKYPMVNPIETGELNGIFDSAIIIDARAAAEYGVIHMVGAKNILLSKMQEKDLLAVRSKDGSRPIVFYCNGITCSKSYKATRKAVGWGFKNVRCYDSGIFNWAKAHPEKAEFFGRVLNADGLNTSLISSDELKKAKLAPRDFLAKYNSGNFTLIDIRSPSERSEVRMHLPKTKAMSFDTLIKMVEGKSKSMPSSNILVVDNVGKQVRWLQYYLERSGITNYYFLDGGAKRWVEDGYSATGRK